MFKSFKIWVEAERGGWVGDAGVVSSSVIGACGLFLIRALTLSGMGGFDVKRELLPPVVLSLKLLGLLSNLYAEETQMLASAPRLNSADRPMKTSVLRQRKGSVRKQHLLSWAWQQGRGQVVEILQSEKQTERWQRSWRWVVERGITFQPLNLEMLVRTNNSLTDRRPRNRIPRWRLFIRKKKEDMVITHQQLPGRPCKMGGRTKIFQIIKVGILAYQVPAYFLNLKLIRTMLVPNLVSRHHQVFFPNHQATGSLFPLILQIRK